MDAANNDENYFFAVFKLSRRRVELPPQYRIAFVSKTRCVFVWNLVESKFLRKKKRDLHL